MKQTEKSVDELRDSGAFNAAEFLSQADQVKSVSALSATITLGWRALLKIKHVPFQLFDVTVLPIMMTLIFTYLLGGALAGTPENYVQFLVPGILVQTVLFITIYTGVGLNTDIKKGIYDRFCSLPIWSSAPIFGALVGDVLRYSIAAVVVILLGCVLGFRPQGGLLGVVAAVVLVQIFSFSVSWIWIILSMYVKSPESVMTTSFIFLFPLTFTSNIFVDPSTMPPFLQAIVHLNPVTHLVTASRGLMHGGSVGGSVMWVLAASAVITAIFAPIALRIYHKER